MREGDDDSNNEHGLLRYNGPYRYLTSAPSFNRVISQQGSQTAKVVKYGNVRIYGIPSHKAHRVEEGGAQ